MEVLNAIYETDFLGFSYGFRPGRSQHHALDALVVGIYRRRSELDPGCRYPGVLGDGIIMPPGSCGWAEEVGLLVYDSDAQAFSLAAANVNRRELAALDTLQHGLA